MDETPEELEQIKREAEAIDPHKYRRRYRVLMTLVAVAFCTGAVWVAIRMAEASRNPCERVRNHYCRKAPDQAKCDSYQVIFNAFKRIAAQYSEAEKTALFSTTAAKVYRLALA